MNDLLVISLSILAFVYLGLFIFNVLRIRAFRIGPILPEAMTLDEVPKPQREVLIEGIAPWLQQGFESMNVCRHAVETLHQSEYQIDRYSVLMRHKDQPITLSLSLNFLPDAVMMHRAELITRYPDRSLHTVSGDETLSILGEGPMSVQSIIDPDPSVMFEAHVAWMASRIDDSEPAIAPTSDSALQAMREDQERYLSILQNKGYAKEVSGLYQFTVSGAIAAMKALKSHQTARAKLFLSDHEPLNKTSAEQLVTAETHALDLIEAHEQGNRFNAWIKTALFALTAVGFAALFGGLFSWRILVVLIPVLLFHELGHLLAMRLFGYRNLQVLFMPLGAAVLGRKDDASVMQKVMVYLAGPVPGLVVASLVIVLVPEWYMQPWIAELVVMLLILNYLNLLPFGPLDGGQIVQHLLFARLPIALIIFEAISVLAFLVLAWWLRDPIILLVAGFTAMALWGSIKRYPIARRVLALRSENALSEGQANRAVFSAMTDRKLWFQPKAQLVKILRPILRAPRAHWGVHLSGMMLYLTILLAPIAVGMVFFYQPIPDEYFGDMSTTEYWDGRLSIVDSELERLLTLKSATQSLIETGNVEQAEAYLEEALSYDALIDEFDETIRDQLLTQRWTIDTLLNRPTAVESEQLLRATLANDPHRLGFMLLQHANALPDADRWAIRQEALAVAKQHDLGDLSDYIVDDMLMDQSTVPASLDFEALLRQRINVPDADQATRAYRTLKLANYLASRQRLDDAYSVLKQQLRQMSHADRSAADLGDLVTDLHIHAAWLALHLDRYDEVREHRHQSQLHRQWMSDQYAAVTPEVDMVDFHKKYVGLLSKPTDTHYAIWVAEAWKAGQVTEAQSRLDIWQHQIEANPEQLFNIAEQISDVDLEYSSETPALEKANIALMRTILAELDPSLLEMEPWE